MLIFIYRLFCGYLYVRVTSKNPEKILNLCSANGINVWRVLLKNDKLYFKIGIASFKKLRIYKRNIPAKVHITKKVGFPFFVARNRKRYGMAAGFAVFFVILNLLSSFVWNICISGNQTVKSADIIESLKKIGIYEGASISKIDPNEKRNELLLLENGLSWAAINIEGSKLTVDVVETKALEQKEDFPSNLKAACEGVVKKVEVISGVLQVKPGDAIEKGQLLVSGINEYEDQTNRLVRSQGKIYAEVTEVFEVSQPLVVDEFLKTGESAKRSVLEFFGLKIPLFLGSITDTFDSTSTQQKISSGEPYVPVKIYSKNFFKTKRTTYTLNEDTAKKRALDKLNNLISKYIGDGELEDRNDEIVISEDVLYITSHIKCTKDVVFEEKMQLDTRN